MGEAAVVDFGILAGAGAPTRSYKAGDIIFGQGDPAEEFIVKSGKVEVRLGNRLLDTLPELSIFGEMALIDHSPRSGRGGCGNRRNDRAGRGEAVFVFGESHTALCAQGDARSGAAFALS
jgi:Cyclic nucleotide-binding domain